MLKISKACLTLLRISKFMSSQFYLPRQIGKFCGKRGRDLSFASALLCPISCTRAHAYYQHVLNRIDGWKNIYWEKSSSYMDLSTLKDQSLALGQGISQVHPKQKGERLISWSNYIKFQYYIYRKKTIPILPKFRYSQFKVSHSHPNSQLKQILISSTNSSGKLNF